MTRMIEAMKSDHHAIVKKTLSINRILLSKEVDNMMRKKHIQSEFLEQNGLQILADWIDLNPDHTFPQT